MNNLFDAAIEREHEEAAAVKITSLELENVKRVKAVKLEPTQSGLTVIGGKNNQGKTSVLDAITWALGGEKYKPSQAKRDGSLVDPHIQIKLSNGIIVERSGKSSALKVTDPTGKRAGQSLLNSFVSTFALDMPKFLNASSKEKASTLLQIIGVGDELQKLEAEESSTYARRTEIGRIADQKKKFADELPQWDGVPDEIVSASDLIKQQQDILARNAQRQQWIRDHDHLLEEASQIEDKIEELKKQLHDINKKIRESDHSPAELALESTDELEQNIANVDAINAKIRDNLSKQKAEEEAAEYRQSYDDMTAHISKLRRDRMALLEGAHMPLPGLSVEKGEIVYKGQQWDNMSSSQQMIVATAIVRELNPKCGFVLLDKLEQMDVDTMKDFGSWLQKEGLQAIATRVSTGDECSIYIEDGYSYKDGIKTAATEIKPAEAAKAPEPEIKPVSKWGWKETK